MSKNSEAQRAKLGALDERACAYGNFAQGFVDGHATVEPTKARPETSHEIGRGRWVRDPADTSIFWVTR